MSQQSRQVAVIGGGISGLACAHRLRSLGIEPTVFEAAPRAGGRIRTIHRDGCEFEAGPNTLLPTKQPTIDLLRELGLEDEVILASDRANRRYVVSGGELCALPTSPIAALRSPLLGVRGVARAVADLWLRPRADVPRDETVASFITRRFGRRVLDNIVAPFVSGIYAGDVDRLEARSVFPDLVDAEDRFGSVICGMIASRRAQRKEREGSSTGRLTMRRPRSITFPGGLERVPQRLEESLGKRVRLGARVIELREESDGRPTVLTQCGVAEAFDAIVIATEPEHAAELIARGRAGMSSVATRDALRAIDRSGLAVVGLLFPRDAVQHPLDGFGYLVRPAVVGAADESPVLGVLFRSSTFPHTARADRVLLTVFMGGARHDLRHLDDASLVRIALGHVRETLGISGSLVTTFLARWPEAIAQPHQGHNALRERITEWNRDNCVRIVSSAVFGVSLNACIATARDEAVRLAAWLDRPRAAQQKERESCASNRMVDLSA